MQIEQFNQEPKPVAVSFNQQNQDRQQRTFWFAREDGSTFCTNEEEAWNLIRYGNRLIRNGEMVRIRPKYLGASSGAIYHAALQEANKLMKEKGLEEAQRLLREAQEQERLSADPKIAPVNYDVMGEPKAVAEFNGSRLR